MTTLQAYESCNENWSHCCFALRLTALVQQEVTIVSTQCRGELSCSNFEKFPSAT